MSIIASLKYKISETDRLIRSHERAMVAYPEDALALSYSVQALVKQREKLVASFENASNQIGHEVCRYRLFKDAGNPSVDAISTVLHEFQHLVAMVFWSLKRDEPLTKSIIPASIQTKTSFQFGYSYVGSVGITLTIPSEQMLFDELSDLDESVETVFGIAAAEDADVISEYAAKLGRPVIQSAFKWATANVKHGVGSDIKWCRNGSIRHEMFIECQKFQRFKDAVESTGEESVAQIKGTGTLLEAGVQPKTFKLSIDGADDVVRGTFENAIDNEHRAEVPGRYSFVLSRTSRVSLSTGEEKVSYVLTELTPV
ncbi:hypothetical protein [Rhodopirellula halodulae]|uniref:hypothetical protein n=1 Tax=Rhodopirellula halodulae TaxID=2894198 RepID=UPI001E543F1F|nr:hypothetical protein [Rhodopirellula sp. JC737]MCC9655131.1 hypothetical protein [Rhodopirellula sp. JC737]